MRFKKYERMPDVEISKLIEGLKVYQIELEMQNEALRNSQEELMASRKKYSDLYDFAPVGYFTISEKGLILEANLTGASMLGVERSLLIKKPLSRFMAKEDADKYYIKRRMVSEEKVHETLRVKIIREDGTEFYALLRCAAAAGEGKNCGQCRTIMIDITE